MRTPVSSATSEAEQRNEQDETHQPRLTILRACGYLLFFLMLFVPTTYQPVKFSMLLICLVSIVASKPSIRIQKGFARATVFLSSVGALEILYGEIRGNEGAFGQVTVWVLWPLVFLLLSSAIYTENHLRSLFRVMITASITIGLYGCLYTLTQTGRLPQGFYFEGIDQGQGFYTDGNVFGVSFNPLSSLLFLGPFLVALAITWPRDRRPVARSYWIYLGIVLDVAFALLSGRRALLVGLVITPIILIAGTRVSRARLSRFVVPILALCAAVIVAVKVMHVDVEATLTGLTTGYKAVGDEARGVQFQSLMDGWREHPVFGAGIGAVAPGPIRSLKTPWAYELSYAALLFDIGIVGVLIYATAVGNIIRRTASVAKATVELRPWAIPVLAGMASFLIAQATNPYLLNFDSMWVIFLPVALLNVNAVRKNTQTPAEHRSMGQNGALRP